MRNVTLLLLAAVMLFGSAVCAPNAPNVIPPPTGGSQRELSKKEFVLELEKTTVALVVSKGNDVLPFCSGVWIGDKEILTAYHCIRPHIENKIEEVTYKMITDKEMKPKHATIMSTDEENDLAILSADLNEIESHPVAMLAHETWDGQHVNIVGHTVGLWWTYMEGVVSSTRVKEDSKGRPRLVLQVSSPMWEGNSGGGAWDDQGRLLGIGSFVLTKVPMIGFFVHYEHIKQLMSRAR